MVLVFRNSLCPNTQVIIHHPQKRIVHTHPPPHSPNIFVCLSLPFAPHLPSPLRVCVCLDVASLLSAINHPEQALFEAAIAGSAAVALASSSAQQAGAAALTGSEAIAVAASSGVSSVANRYNPAPGSMTHNMVHATSYHMAASRANGEPLNPIGAFNHAIEREATSVVNIGAGQLVRAYTGLPFQPNFTTQELKMMSNAIRPSDVDMVRHSTQTNKDASRRA